MWLEESKLATGCFDLAPASSPSGSYLWKCPAMRNRPPSSFTFFEIVRVKQRLFGGARRPQYMTPANGVSLQQLRSLLQFEVRLGPSRKVWSPLKGECVIMPHIRS